MASGEREGRERGKGEREGREGRERGKGESNQGKSVTRSIALQSSSDNYGTFSQKQQNK